MVIVKKQLLVNLIELRLLIELFLIENINIKDKIKDIIIILMQMDSEKNYTNLLNYDKEQLLDFCNVNIDNLLKDF